jgi:hypothetical protein
VLRFTSQFLSVYLLTLYLVAAPLHRHADATPEDVTITVTTADACQLCDWMAQPALSLAEACFVEGRPRLPELLSVVAPSSRIAGWTGFSDSSRAPPAA